jgi:hypothetical protein
MRKRTLCAQRHTVDYRVAAAFSLPLISSTSISAEASDPASAVLRLIHPRNSLPRPLIVFLPAAFALVQELPDFPVAGVYFETIVQLQTGLFKRQFDVDIWRIRFYKVLSHPKICHDHQAFRLQLPHVGRHLVPGDIRKQLLVCECFAEPLNNAEMTLCLRRGMRSREAVWLHSSQVQSVLQVMDVQAVLYKPPHHVVVFADEQALIKKTDLVKDASSYARSEWNHGKTTAEHVPDQQSSL